jgi:hypothetical protein
MDIKMCVNNSHSLKNSHDVLGQDILKKIYYKKNNKRELLINEFIKKFPKVKLHTIIEVNKYYTNHYDIYGGEIKIPNENVIVNDYLIS